MTERTMRAVASYRGLPVGDPESLVDVELPLPDPGPLDVLVRVLAVSVNPVDVKVRAGLPASEEPRVLGFDAAGVVEAVGEEVTTLQAGDEVWYAGDLNRAYSNAEFQAVDERLVARKPRTFGFTDAAALPLTGITAWETLFDRFALDGRSTGTLLALGGAGGVGSILIQLAKQLTGLRVLASAGRPETAQWVTGLGADAVVDHHDLAATAAAAAPEGVDYLLSPHSASTTSAPTPGSCAPAGTSRRSTNPRAWTCCRSRPRASRGTGSSCSPGRCSGPPT